jgi:hypothetical protein
MLIKTLEAAAAATVLASIAFAKAAKEALSWRGAGDRKRLHIRDQIG